MTTICGTGHRPNKLGGYSPEAFSILIDVAVRGIRETNPTLVISGMALGWDQALAEAALKLHIPFIAAVPFESQSSAWPLNSQLYYNELLAQAVDRVVVCDGGYAAWKMQKRNEWMVDNADLVLALWDGSPGGTANCIRYAIKEEKPINNVWSFYEQIKRIDPNY